MTKDCGPGLTLEERKELATTSKDIINQRYPHILTASGLDFSDYLEQEPCTKILMSNPVCAVDKSGKILLAVGGWVYPGIDQDMEICLYRKKQKIPENWEKLTSLEKVEMVPRFNQFESLSNIVFKGRKEGILKYLTLDISNDGKGLEIYE